MKKNISALILLIFLASLLFSAYAATENVIMRVGYPQIGDHQYVGTVRIYETDSTIDSIQNGDMFTIFLENAEFMSYPTLLVNGRYDVNVVSGGNDGDSYISYQFAPSTTGGTGRVIVDFEFDDMRAIGGDITARIDSQQTGVTSGYFSLGGEEEKDEDPKVISDEVIVSSDKIIEAKDNGVNLVINNNNYQLVIPNNILEGNIIEEGIKNNQRLMINIKREKPSELKYLTELYSISISLIDKEDNEKVKLTTFDNPLYLKIKDPDVNDKRNVKGVLIKEPQNEVLSTHYDVTNDHIIIQINSLSNKLSIIRASNYRELVYDKDEFILFEGEKYIPVRQSASYYGWDVVWNHFTRTVNLAKENKTIDINDYIIVNERSYVPANFVMENLDAPLFILDEQVVLKYN